MVPPPGLKLFASDIVGAAAKHGIPPDLLAAVVWQESSANPRAYRYEPAFWTRYLAGNKAYAAPAGIIDGTPAHLEHEKRVSASYGLCQLMYATARWLGYGGQPEGLYDVATSLELGAQLLQMSQAKTGTWEGALLKYNGGGRPEYVDEVLAKVTAIRATV